MIVDEDLCVVATNERTADPHYLPTKNNNHLIEKNSLLLIDIWAKQNKKDAIFADSTFIAWIGPDDIPGEVQNIWKIVTGARDAGVSFIQENCKSGVSGFEVDKVVRSHIEERGFGEKFIHRTGHAIDTSDHGKGANIDNFEICDTRKLILGSLFSIEPGIYLKNNFGIRSEINIYIDENLNPTVTTFKQDSILVI